MIYCVYYQRFFGLLKPAETRLKYLHFTHRFVKQVESDLLDRVYGQMQGEVWSPHGEARSLIKSLHLSHTSLSVGDVVQETGGGYWVCNDLGWLPVRSDRFWPNRRTKAQPLLWLATVADLRDKPPQLTGLKISDEPDCLPPDAWTVESFAWTAFDDLVTLAKLLEQRLGLQVCIDFGADFYETEVGDDNHR